MILCQFEDGAKAHLRHAVVDALVVENNKILLVRRTPKLLEGGKYALPGGYVDPHETLEACVLRELKEETGYTAHIEKLLFIVDNPHRKNDARQNLSFVYKMKSFKKEGTPDWENTEVGWFSLDALPSETDMAFDHASIIKKYLAYRKKPFLLPHFISQT